MRGIAARARGRAVELLPPLHRRAPAAGGGIAQKPAAADLRRRAAAGDAARCQLLHLVIAGRDIEARLPHRIEIGPQVSMRAVDGELVGGGKRHRVPGQHRVAVAVRAEAKR